jgi:putative transcriptional regulator
VESLRGTLLIAAGSLFDPNFRQTVVLVADHNDEGAVGVVLNRRAEATVAEAAPPLAAFAPPEDHVYVGGPVLPQAAVLVAEFEHPDLAEKPVLGAIGLVIPEPEAAQPAGVRRARVFAGYAGWGPGQLEGEIEAGGWILEPARPDDVFTASPERLWRDVLRRKGKEFAVLALMPFDPTGN